MGISVVLRQMSVIAILVCIGIGLEKKKVMSEQGTKLISKLVEEERDRKRVTGREIINNHDHDCPDDYDDNDDTFESTGDMY